VLADSFVFTCKIKILLKDNDPYFCQRSRPLRALVLLFFIFLLSYIVRIPCESYRSHGLGLLEEPAELAVLSPESLSFLSSSFCRKTCLMVGSSLSNSKISRFFCVSPLDRAFIDDEGLSLLTDVDGPMAIFFSLSNVCGLWSVNFFIFVLQKNSTFSLPHNFVLYSFHYLTL